MDPEAKRNYTIVNIRIRALHDRIKKKRYPSIDEMAKKFEVSRRTIERDIEKLRNYYGAPVEYCRTNKGYFYTDNIFDLPKIDATEKELQALLLAQKILNHLQGLPYRAEGIRIVEKIFASLDSSRVIAPQDMMEYFFFDVGNINKPYEPLEKIIHILSKAIKKNKQAKIKYFTITRNKKTERNISPKCLKFHQGSWYLIGYCHLREGYRYFALNRIQDIEMSSKDAYHDDDFSLENFIEESFGIERDFELHEVKIKFNQRQARWIKEKIWHHTQKIEDLNCGGIVLIMNVTGLSSIKRWVLGYGACAEVLQPVELRKEIAEEVKALSQIY